MTGKRADVALVDRGLFESRSRAQEAIAAGLVTADGQIVRKASAVIADGAAIVAEAPHPWVSRGGVKLTAALDHFGYDPAGRLCLDVGSSTGGFTHVLLARGASRVVAVDVGRDQLHPSLRRDERIDSREGTDARTLRPEDLPAPPSVFTFDVSFIPLKLVLPPVLALATTGAFLVALVKPQFEAGREHVRKGIVRDEGVRRAVCDGVADSVARLGWLVDGIMASPIAGGDGNVEYLLGARSPEAARG